MRISDQILALGVFLAGASSLQSAENCSGAPFVNVTRPRVIEESAGAIVGPQIFDVAAHPRGFLLMANNYGLLSYDGVGWRLMPLGRSAVTFSVAVHASGRIFAGGSRTFGEVVEDPAGKLLYQPLESRLPPEDRAFSDVWQTLVSPGGLAYFRSPERLIVLRNGDDARSWAAVGRFSAAGLVGEVLYAHDTALGIISLSKTRNHIVPGGEAFRNVRVTVIADGADGSLLIGTQDRGLFRLNSSDGKSEHLSAVVPVLQSSEILSIGRLSDGQIAVGTLRSGLFVLDGNGKLLLRMDRDTGLPDNAVLSLHASNGSLWAGTSGGVAQLLLPGSVQGFSGKEGLPGIVEAIVQHKGSIFAATSQGVFRMTCANQAFQPLAALRKQSFALLSAGSLLVATAEGIFEIDGSSTRLVRPGLARGFSASSNESRIWAATQTGALALIRRGGRWFADSPLTLKAEESQAGALVGVEATSVGENADGRLWMSLVTGRVISGLPTLNEGRPELTEIRAFGEAEGIASGFAEVISLKDGIRIGTGSAVLRPQGEGLARDAAFAAVLGGDKGAFRIEDAKDGGYWIAAAKRPLRLTRDGAVGGLLVRSVALLRAPAGSRILDFLEVSPAEVWIGTDDGAFRYDPSAEARVAYPISAHVRRVLSNQQDLFAGGPTDALEDELPHLAPLRFEVSSSSLDDPSRNRFRFRLDGQDADWSPWTLETRKDYTNLSPGRYRFRVEARDVYGRIGREGGLSFVVRAPWHRKPWAITIGIAALAALFYALLGLRTRTLRRRQHELEAIVEQKTTELREAAFTDPLTGLRNRRYFGEVIEAEASLACRPGSAALHLFLVDLDHFKQVNDTHGHAAGDEVLRQTSARLKTAMRTSDLIFRWGGEEFLIVARGATNLFRNEIANRIVRIVGDQPFDIGGETKLTRTCSVGFSTFPFYPENPTTVPLDAVIELADLSLYRAKKTGRNRAVGVSPLAGAPVTGDVWKSQILENLEQAAVSVEVLEGRPSPIS